VEERGNLLEGDILVLHGASQQKVIKHENEISSPTQ
jgi:hypothetical protein